MTVRRHAISLQIYVPTKTISRETAAFRALVEENVKSNVQKIANSAVIRDVRNGLSASLYSY